MFLGESGTLPARVGSEPMKRDRRYASRWYWIIGDPPVPSKSPPIPMPASPAPPKPNSRMFQFEADVPRRIFRGYFRGKFAADRSEFTNGK